MPEQADAPRDEAAGAPLRLEWCYDLDRPLLAEVDLLSARPSYPTTLVTEDGTFPAEMRLPTTPAVEHGLANFLAPPRDWGLPSREADERWGTHYRDQALGVKGVAIKRIAFTVETHDALVDPAIRAEFGPDLLAQQILLNIDTWWDNVRTWLEIATNQRLAQVGHEPRDWPNPNTRTSIWEVDDNGGRKELSSGGTVIVGPERVLAVTQDILRDCVALAMSPPPLAWRLLRDARALQNADQLRRAVIDAATAAELALTKRIDDLLATQTDPKARQTLQNARMLGRKAAALQKVGEQLPAHFTRDLIDRRNYAVHEAVDVLYPEWEAAFGAALALVDHAFPLPTAPGSTTPLTCYWSRTTRPEMFPRTPIPGGDRPSE